MGTKQPQDKAPQLKCQLTCLLQAEWGGCCTHCTLKSAWDSSPGERCLQLRKRHWDRGGGQQSVMLLASSPLCGALN